MKSMFWTSAPTGFPGAGSADLRPFGAGFVSAALPGTSLPGCGGVRLRAPEAFTAPYQGTGLPIGGDVLVRTAVQQNVITHTDDTTLGIHSSRPPG